MKNRIITFIVALIVGSILAMCLDFYTMYHTTGLAIGMSIFCPVKWVEDEN